MEANGEVLGNRVLRRGNLVWLQMWFLSQPCGMSPVYPYLYKNSAARSADFEGEGRVRLDFD